MDTFQGNLIRVNKSLRVSYFRLFMFFNFFKPLEFGMKHFVQFQIFSKLTQVSKICFVVSNVQPISPMVY